VSGYLVSAVPAAAPRLQDSIGFGFQAMACECEIRLCLAEDGELPALQAAAQSAIDEVRRIEAKYSRYQPDSLVSRINAAAGTGRDIEVDAETGALLDFAAQLFAQSDGLFDITSGVLRRAWDFRAARIPGQAELDALLPLVGWHKVLRQGRLVRLTLPGMEIDFGGFGKEYAADRAMTLLAGAGQRHGFVNLGGDIRVLGPRSDGSAWRFGIQHPRTTGSVIAGLDLAEGALATSGDYERYFECNGRRYCHILDPRSGWPVAHWASISVAAPACVAAGALSTIAMLKGEHAPAFLDQQQAGWLAIDPLLRAWQGVATQARQFQLDQDNHARHPACGRGPG
jgi:thiamine biosynthesis lipoprotein